MKTNIDESIQRWSGFLEHVKQEGKIIEKFEDALPELEEFQGTMSEKRDQLEKLKVYYYFLYICCNTFYS